MGKIRALTLNSDYLKGADPTLMAQLFFFRLSEIQRVEGSVSPQFLALDVLAAFVGGKMKGYLDEELLSICPEEWGAETATVPVGILNALVDGWMNYMTAGPGRTLGESFGLEGGGQGSRKMKQKNETFHRNRSLANAVEFEYLIANAEGNAISERLACARVAERRGIS